MYKSRARVGMYIVETGRGDGSVQKDRRAINRRQSEKH